MALVPYDARDGWIWLDGEFVAWREAQVHVLSHALHYGSAVFEGERAYGGEVFKLTEHSQRLVDSARLLGFELPYDAAAIDAATRAAIAKNGLGDCYVRPIAWRGSEMMGVSAQACSVHVAIAVWEWGAYYSDLKLTQAPFARPAPSTAPVHSKAAGLYMICTISKHAAEAKGFGDALMLDHEGYVAETTGANIFMVKGDTLHTPLADRFLNGITRKAAIELARARGFTVVERRIRPEELAGADEIFVTGTAAEITPVRAIDDQVYPVGRVTGQLIDDFRALTTGQVAAEAAA